MPKNTKYLWRILIIALYAAIIWFFLSYVLTFILPFLCSIVLARLMHPSISALQKRVGIPRQAGAAFLTVFIIGSLAGVLIVIFSAVFSELNSLLEFLPQWAERIPEVSTALRTKMELLAESAPESFRDILRDSGNQLLNESVAIPTSIYRFLAARLSSVAAGMPGFIFFLVALILSTYFMASDYPRISKLIMRPFSRSAREKILQTKNLAANTVGRWFKAQGVLLLMTFGGLLAGFFILRVNYSLMLAFIVAILDALPVIGIGMVLLPWGIISVLIGQTQRGIGILVLFAVINMARSFIGPKIIGAQIGQHPLVTLISMYVGFKAFNLMGMIIFPILSSIITQMFSWGWFRGIMPRHLKE